MEMSGTPYWVSSDCEGQPAEREGTDMSKDETALLALSYKEVASATGHLKTMPFLKAPNGTFFSEYYSSTAMMGLVSYHQSSLFFTYAM